LAIQSQILDALEQHNLVTDFPPIVAVNKNSANPHYAPNSEAFAAVTRGDFLLIDLWAKEKDDDAVFADITWTGFLGAEVPIEIQKIFQIVKEARDAAVEVLREALAQGRPLRGFEVDIAARSVIEAAGYGDSFFHRTGHNLGQNVHGNGVNFDDLETHDSRLVIPKIGCTIEPGIYMEEFGVRSEIDVYIEPSGPRVTTPPQDRIVTADP
jgi:Xaa-Pro aminopeptidase